MQLSDPLWTWKPAYVACCFKVANPERECDGIGQIADGMLGT